MKHEVIIAGVGMIPFTKPGASDTYDVTGEAGTLSCPAGYRKRQRGLRARATKS